jgi:hypothetical protein
MRPSTCLPTLLLAHLHSTAASMNNAFARSFALLADMGLNPNGTPMSPTGASNFRTQSASTGEGIVPEYIELPIDNFAHSKNQAYAYHGTFFNRYWVSSAHYKPGAPIFLYDVGESDASTNALFRLQDNTSFFRQLVAQYNGIGIVWEHRFYGNSSPTPVDINTPASDFEFLTTEQSLADVDRFARQFSRPNINHTLTPDGSPWVFVGGSYPGMRAAFMRQHYPDTIFAAYASSAPVQAAVDQSSYYEPMWFGLNRYGFGNCSKDIQAAVRWVDGVLDTNATKAEEVKTMFLGKGAESNSHATFADALTTIFAAWMSYGVEGGVLGLRRFCDWIETDTDGMLPVVAGKDGWSKTKGAEWVASRWASYPWFVGNVNQYLETECSGRDDVVGECDLDKRFSEPNVIAWTWQYCNEWGESILPFTHYTPSHLPFCFFDMIWELTDPFDTRIGFFQSANLGPHQLTSKYNSLTHWRDICTRQFPSSSLPPWPAVAATNRLFGGWSIRPSNTYWSNGEFDPWRTLSPASAPNVRVTQKVPKCGREMGKGELFGYTLPDAQHCYDFRTGQGVKGSEVSRKLFTDALTEWLRCWRPKKGGKPGVGKPGIPGKP